MTEQTEQSEILETEETADGFAFKALYKSQQLSYGDPFSRVVVVCGWHRQDEIVKTLPEGSYAAAGQLYSPTTGLSILIRNLLYNPQIDTVIYCTPNAMDNNAGSIAALIAFFNDGVVESISSAERPCWRTIGGGANGSKGEIEKEIPFEALEELRSKVTIGTLTEYLGSYTMKREIENSKSEKPRLIRGQRQIFPVQSIDGKRLPGAYIGHKIESETIADAFPEILHRIRSTGRIRPNGYGGYWQELIDMMVVINNEPEGYKFAPYLPVDASYIESYLPQMCEPLKDKNTGIKYTYGSRIREYFGHDQLKQVIDKLIAEIDSCSAVINLWDAGGIRDDKSSDHQHGGSPCLNHIWVRVYDDYLALIATFRSNDMYGAWVANAMGLRHLQILIVEALNDNGFPDLKPGKFVTQSYSAHLYDHAFDAADQLIAKRNKKQTYSDPVGNFLVCWDAVASECYIAQEYPQGVEAAQYRGTDALKLVRDVCFNNPAIQSSHAGYLALEVQRCILLKDAYRQDSRQPII